MNGRMDSKTVVAAGFPAASANVAPGQFHPVPGCLTGLREQFREYTRRPRRLQLRVLGVARFVGKSLVEDTILSNVPIFLSSYPQQQA